MRPTARPLIVALVLVLPLASAAQDGASPLETLTGDVVISEPAPEPRGYWYGSAELAIVRPRVEQYPSDLHTGVRLDTTVSPEFSLGYRFAGGRALHFDYRFLSSSGTQSYYPQQQLVGLGPNDEIVIAERPYTGHAGLDLHTFDLDFAFRDPPWDLLPFVRSRWEIGARAAVLSADVVEPRTFDDRGGWGPMAAEWFGDERLATEFRGGGPHFDYKLALASEAWGLEVFALSDLAVLFGTRTARYSPEDAQPVRNGRAVGPGWSYEGVGGLMDARPVSEHRFSATAWNWRGDVGAKLTRPWRGRLLTVAAGYRMDFWTINGRSPGGGGFGSFFGGSIKVPDFEFDVKGVFLRVELQF